MQHALPKLTGILQSLRKALLQNSQHLANRLEGKIQGLQDNLDTLIQGQIPITFTDYFGAGPADIGTDTGTATATTTVPVPVPMPVPVPVAPLLTGPSLPVPPLAAEPGPPMFTALARAFTVKDVWRK